VVIRNVLPVVYNLGTCSLCVLCVRVCVFACAQSGMPAYSDVGTDCGEGC